ncbi:gastrula zinc finger protein XlCGF46.1-like [Planococcus citri]|uniref:gastrula zinc finger protein XlCGF46.1-like n=1 Tax=Planococcus citri TaxID=170843 RepID=UPI0031F9AE78
MLEHSLNYLWETEVLEQLCKIFECPRSCGRQYKNKAALENHMKKLKCPEGNKRLFICSELQFNVVFVCPNGCGRQYKSKGPLQRHLKYECGQEKQFECSACSKKFSPVSGTETTFVCPNACGCQYTYKRSLQRHLKYECGQSKQQFKCLHCDRLFSRNDNLRAHYVVAHNTLLD